MVRGLCRGISADQEKIPRDGCGASGGREHPGLSDLAGQHVHPVCDARDVPDTAALCGDL